MRRILLAILIAISVDISVRADIVNYGNFVGSEVCFNGVLESSSKIGTGAGQVPSLFAAPTVVGNMLVFNPTQFEANQAGTGIDLTDSQLLMSIVAKPGFVITGIQINEFGDYTIATPFSGGQGFVNVSANGFASNSAGTFVGGFSQGASSNTPFGQFGVSWTDGFNISFPEVASTSFTMDNTLVAAAATATDAAFIKKKGLKITVFTTAIPEPGSLSLLLLGGLIALNRSRRGSRS